MVKTGQKCLDLTLKVVVILTAIVVLTACSSFSPGSDSDQSGQYGYKGRIHTVNRGETLVSIALRYGIGYKELADFNGIKPPYTIYPGQPIRVDIHAARGWADGRNKSAGSSRDGGGAVGRGKVPEKNSRSLNKTKNPDLSSKNTFAAGTVKWQWPASGKLLAQFQGENGLNKGIDINGNLGEPVLAAASGQVVYAGSGLSGYGNLLIIKHSDTFLSAYAHNRNLLVKEGESVKAGQRIADMGSSGTDRVKLHFEIRSDGNPVDPLKYLPKR